MPLHKRWSWTGRERTDKTVDGFGKRTIAYSIRHVAVDRGGGGPRSTATGRRRIPKTTCSKGNHLKSSASSKRAPSCAQCCRPEAAPNRTTSRRLSARLTVVPETRISIANQSCSTIEDVFSRSYPITFHSFVLLATMWHRRKCATVSCPIQDRQHRPETTTTSAAAAAARPRLRRPCHRFDVVCLTELGCNRREGPPHSPAFVAPIGGPGRACLDRAARCAVIIILTDLWQGPSMGFPRYRDERSY